MSPNFQNFCCLLKLRLESKKPKENPKKKNFFSNYTLSKLRELLSFQNVCFVKFVIQFKFRKILRFFVS